jgi:cytochrome c-type biogenesis protein CcmH/NrfG
MAETNGTAETSGAKGSKQRWTSMQAYILAVICLIVGFGVGYLLRGPGGKGAPAAAGSSPQAMSGGGKEGFQHPSAEQIQEMANKQAEPLLAKLKNNPKDLEVLTQLGNLYYDAQLYPKAIDYYKKVLAETPKNASVRTDLATALFYIGDFDDAISEFDTALKDDPKNGNALFNRGIAKWQGKMDIEGALADWNKLLKENPGYEHADEVKKYIDQANVHRNVKPGEKTNKPAM